MEFEDSGLARLNGVGVADDAFDALAAALDAVAAVPLWQLRDIELGTAVGLLARVEARVQAVQVAVLSEAVGRGVPGQRGAKSAGVWFRRHAALTPAQAAARAALAQDLTDPELAPTRAAFGAGEFSAAHAGVITRTVKALAAQREPVDDVTRAEAQSLLVQTAARVDPAQLGRAGMRVRYRLDPDAPERLAKDEDAQERAREAYLVQDHTGMWQLGGCLPPVAGAALHAVLDPLAKPQPAADGTPDARTGRQRTADALKVLAETTLAARAGQPNALPTRAGAHCRLVLLAPLETVVARAGASGQAGLAGRSGTTGLAGSADRSGTPGLAGLASLAGLPPGELATGEPGGWPVSPLTVQELACDAEIVPVLTDDTGRPLDVGQTVYPFPPKIRTAIEVRDRHCTFEGCTAPPAWCHTHHLVRYPDGPTSEANGTLLCGRHHRFVHARHWQGRLLDGHIHWRPPDTNDDVANAYDQHFEQLLRQLAARWLTRNPHLNQPELRDTG